MLASQANPNMQKQLVLHRPLHENETIKLDMNIPKGGN
tara:strand:- start:4046 stop:4159 length:114 start_codon:yes stop_codon:yes gene_type:complete